MAAFESGVYWIWLQIVFGWGSHRINALVSRFDTAREIYEMSPQDREACRCFTRNELDTMNRTPMEKASAVYERCKVIGCRVITPENAEYPERLRNIYAMPAVLYVKGSLAELDKQLVFSMVGTRKCSEYGVRVADLLSHQLARYGALIASGCASGIDTACLNGAAHECGGHIGVLGCGIDVVYPKENANLYYWLSNYGVLLTEFPPGTRPYGKNFPIRNRILSGISVGTVVVEAPEHSGALITANHALEQGRDVFAVPGRIDDEKSVGALNLIRSGTAKMICCGEDILMEYEQLYPEKVRAMREIHLAKEQPKKPDKPEKDEKTEPVPEAEKQETPSFDWIENAVERQICVCIAQGQEYVQSLVTQTGLSVQILLPALTELELEGLVVPVGLGQYRLTDHACDEKRKH